MRIVKVGIVGSRRRNSEEDKEILRKILLKRIHKGDRIHVVSGGCPLGADRFAEELAEEYQLGISIHLPDKSSLPVHPTYHDFVVMYHTRNTKVAEECDLLLALVAPDRKGGTEDTIKKVESLGKPTVIL